MLTGTRSLQSCGVVLCEIETAAHREQLFAIDLNCFTPLKVAPPTTTPTTRLPCPLLLLHFLFLPKALSHPRLPPQRRAEQ